MAEVKVQNEKLCCFDLRDGTVIQSERKKLDDRFSWFLEDDKFCCGSGNAKRGHELSHL